MIHIFLKGNLEFRVKHGMTTKTTPYPQASQLCCFACPLFPECFNRRSFGTTKIIALDCRVRELRSLPRNDGGKFLPYLHFWDIVPSLSTLHSLIYAAACQWDGATDMQTAACQ